MTKTSTLSTVVHGTFVCLVIGIAGRVMIIPSETDSMGQLTFAKVNADFVSNKNFDDNAISMNSIVVIQSDYQGNENALIEYTVDYGDSLSTIASRFGTTVKNIMEVNGLQTTNLRVGKKIHITPVEGFVLQVKDITNPLVFANQYNIPLDDLLSTNGIDDKMQLIQKGEELFVPMPRDKGIELGLLEKPKPIETARPVIAQTKTTVVQKKNIVATTKTAARANTVQNTEPRQPAQKSNIVSQRTYTNSTRNGFYKGHCTYYAALKSPWAFPFVSDNKQYKSRNGDARLRLGNAKSKGFTTSSSPSIGAIAVFGRGRSAYSAAGHVGVVVDVDRKEKRFLIEDMNYACINCVTKRWVYMDDTMTKEVGGGNGLLGFIPKQQAPDRVWEQVNAEKQL